MVLSITINEHEYSAMCMNVMCDTMISDNVCVLLLYVCEAMCVCMCKE